jgi:threonine synthase
VAYEALSKTLENEPAEQTGFILGTAHPAKFNETMTEILNREISIPPALQNLEHTKINTETIEVDYSKLVKKLKAL